jgi:hypothetical protein
MNDKLTELLTSVYQSVISDETRWHKPSKVSTVKYKEPGFDGKFEDEYPNKTQYEFEIANENMKFRFNVCISKIESVGFFGQDKSKYVTSIEVRNNPGKYQYSTSHIETFWFLSWRDDSLSLQKKIFDYLEQNHIIKSKKDEEEKYETYIGDIKKTITKSGLRDDKLDELLSEQ